MSTTAARSEPYSNLLDRGAHRAALWIAMLVLWFRDGAMMTMTKILVTARCLVIGGGIRRRNGSSRRGLVDIVLVEMTSYPSHSKAS
jgi:hypothetical protein